MSRLWSSCPKISLGFEIWSGLGIMHCEMRFNGSHDKMTIMSILSFGFYDIKYLGWTTWQYADDRHERVQEGTVLAAGRLTIQPCRLLLLQKESLRGILSTEATSLFKDLLKSQIVVPR